MNTLISWTKKALNLSATIWLLTITLVISGCASTSTQIKYVERIVEVPVKPPPQLAEPCDISQRSGERVRDYIVSERRLRNDLVICNLIKESRNKTNN